MEHKDFKLEHYKTMRAEYMHLILYVQRLWNYKLSTLGAVIAISVLNDKLLDIDKEHMIAGIDSSIIISLGILVLPLLAFLIDLKIVEMGMQIKLISNHISKSFEDVPIIADWEHTFWHNKPIASTRTILSLILYVGASTIILLISFMTVAMLQSEWRNLLLIVGTGLIILPIIAMFTLVPKITK